MSLGAMITTDSVDSQLAGPTHSREVDFKYDFAKSRRNTMSVTSQDFAQKSYSLPAADRPTRLPRCWARSRYTPVGKSRLVGATAA